MDTITGTNDARGPTRGMTAGEDDQTAACVDDPLWRTTAMTGGQRTMNVTRRTTVGEEDQTAAGTDDLP